MLEHSFIDDDEDEDEYYGYKNNREDDSDDDEFYEFPDNDDDEGEEEGKDKGFKETATFYCNDCNYRWQKYFYRKSKNSDMDDNEDIENDNMCPMCGSSAIDRV